MIKQLRNKRIWRFFCSIKLALTLLVLITIASIIGTLIPQGLTLDEYIRGYGKTLYNLFAVLGFVDIYHTWWFILLLSLLGLNLLICSLDRALKFSRRTAGLIITHFSLLLILLGALISALFAQKGFIGLYEGEAKDIFFIKDKPYKLSFKLSLEKFNLEWYEPKTHQVIVYLKDRKKKFTYSVKPHEERRIEGTDYSFTVLDYIPNFFIDQDGKIMRKSDLPNNPALSIQISHPQRAIEQRWIFAKFPSFSSNVNKDIKFIYNWKEMIKEFQSYVKVIDQGEVVLSKMIRVNHPLKYKGYTIYQTSYNPDELNWTGLQVVKDPGVALVFAGFIFLNIGLVITYYVKLKS